LQIKQKLWKEYFWSRSYCLLTSGGALIEIIKQYIENQGKKNDDMSAFSHRTYKRTRRKIFYTLYLCCRLYDYSLDQRIKHYKEYGKEFTYREQQNIMEKNEFRW